MKNTMKLILPFVYDMAGYELDLDGSTGLSLSKTSGASFNSGSMINFLALLLCFLFREKRTSLLFVIVLMGKFH